jgi:hypothetical protein|tara:strand:+ start:427 stop:1044 length:618 start_codon:yes stop_codon:yes gene_type:complete
MAINPAYIYAGVKGLDTLFGFTMGRRQDKSYLQKLHQDKLLTRLNTVSNTNIILDNLKSLQADNQTIAGTANYHAFDSASFKAIQKRMTSLAEKDIKNLEMTNAIAISGIDTSLKNLNFNMRLSEFKLIADLGTLGYSANHYVKDQAIEEAIRKAEIKKLNKIYAEIKKQGRITRGYYGRNYNIVRFADRFKKLKNKNYGFYKGR